MNRRRMLGMVGAALGPGLAGCLGGAGGLTPPADGFEADSGGGESDPVAYANVSLPVAESALNRGAPRDGIPAIVEPAFGSDWSGVEATLTESDPVVGVELAGEARAYPLSVLNWHEIVNDDFDRPVLVTFCPLCGSAVVAERTVAGDTRTFGVSGLLWHSDLVMYDRESESLWSQVLATAIRGPLTGTTLDLLPSATTSWGEWRTAHPETTVLLPPPASDTVTGRATRDYDRDPYLGYDSVNRVGIGYNDDVDDRLHPKARVVGVAHGGEAVAYPLSELVEVPLVTDEVGGLPVVVAATSGDTLVAYDRRVGGSVLSFDRPAGTDELVGGGSRWNLLSGRALDGPHEGTTLRRANDRSPMFWFAWAEFFPDTDIYEA